MSINCTDKIEIEIAIKNGDLDETISVFINARQGAINDLKETDSNILKSYIEGDVWVADMHKNLRDDIIIPFIDRCNKVLHYIRTYYKPDLKF